MRRKKPDERAVEQDGERAVFEVVGFRNNAPRGLSEFETDTLERLDGRERVLIVDAAVYVFVLHRGERPHEQCGDSDRLVFFLPSFRKKPHANHSLR